MSRGRRKRREGRIPHDEYVKFLQTEVFPRDGWRCRVPWCRRRDRLCGHHIVFRSHGGRDEATNLLTMCCSCHEDFHVHKRFQIEGTKADEVKFVRWVNPSKKEVLESVLV